MYTEVWKFSNNEFFPNYGINWDNAKIMIW